MQKFSPDTHDLTPAVLPATPRRRDPGRALLEQQYQALVDNRTPLVVEALEDYLKLGGNTLNASELLRSFCLSEGFSESGELVTDQARLTELEDRFSKHLATQTQNWALDRAVEAVVKELYQPDGGPILTCSFADRCFGTAEIPVLFRSFGALITTAAEQSFQVDQAYLAFDTRFDGTQADGPNRETPGHLTPIGYLARCLPEFTWDLPPEAYAPLEEQSRNHYHLAALSYPYRGGPPDLLIMRAAALELVDQFGKIPQSTEEKRAFREMELLGPDYRVHFVGLYGYKILRQLGPLPDLNTLPVEDKSGQIILGDLQELFEKGGSVHSGAEIFQEFLDGLKEFEETGRSERADTVADFAAFIAKHDVAVRAAKRAIDYVGFKTGEDITPNYGRLLAFVGSEGAREHKSFPALLCMAHHQSLQIQLAWDLWAKRFLTIPRMEGHRTPETLVEYLYQLCSTSDLPRKRYHELERQPFDLRLNSLNISPGFQGTKPWQNRSQLEAIVREVEGLLGPLPTTDAEREYFSRLRFAGPSKKSVMLRGSHLLKRVDQNAAQATKRPEVRSSVMILGALFKFEEHLAPATEEDRIRFEARREVYARERQVSNLQFSFEVREANQRAQALFAAVKSVVRRCADSSFADVYTDSFPGIKFVSQSGRTRFGSWAALLQAAARAEFEGIRYQAPDSSRPMSPGEYLRHAIQLVSLSSAVNAKDPRHERRVKADQADYHIAAMVSYDQGLAPAEIRRESPQKILTEIFEQQFGGDPERFRIEELLDTAYAAPGGQTVTRGSELIDSYRMAFHSDLAEVADVTQQLRSYFKSLPSAEAPDRDWTNNPTIHSFLPMPQPKVLHALCRYEEHGRPRTAQQQEEYQRRLEMFRFTRRHAQDLAQLSELFHLGEARQQAEAIHLAAKSAIRRLAHNAPQLIFTCSFPGQRFASPSGHTQFKNWCSLLEAGAAAEAEIAQLEAQREARFGNISTAPAKVTPMSAGQYLRQVIRTGWKGASGYYPSDAVLARGESDAADFHLVALASFGLNGESQVDLQERIPAVVSEIVEQQFDGSAAAFNREAVRAAKYSAPGAGAALTGAELLDRFGLATESALTKLIADAAVSPQLSLSGEVEPSVDRLHPFVPTEAPIEIAALGQYSDHGRKSDRLECLHTIFSEILSQQFGGDPEGFRGKGHPDPDKEIRGFLDTVYSVPPGCGIPQFFSSRNWSESGIKGWQLLFAYSSVLFGTQAALSGTVPQALDHLVAHLTAAVAAERAEKAQAELHVGLKETPALLFRALTIFGWEHESLDNFRAFQARLKKGAVGNPAPAPEASVKTPAKSPVELYAQSLSAAAESGLPIDLTELGLQAHCDLLREMCLHCYDGNVQKLVQDLQRHVESIPAQTSSAVRVRVEGVLSQVCPAVLELFEELSAFTPPAALKRQLFPHQVVAVVENLKLGKRINAHEMGNGKSMVALALCEHHQFERVVWVTGAANRSDVRDEILRSVEIDPSRVKIVPGDAAKWNPERLEAYLKDAKYLVCAYETLRSARKRNPAVHELLCRWTGSTGGLVIDEAHRFDNPDSQRSQALTGMTAEWRYLLTGSVYQARFSRISSLIQLLDPRRFSNLEELQKSCADREFAQVLLGRYASIAFTDDIARHLKPPEIESFQDQLRSGLPHVPRAVDMPLVRVALPPQRAAEYLQIACNFPAWLNARRHLHSIHDQRHTALRQLIWMQRALYDPEKLGQAPALELLDAAKQIALPIMEKGEKVLFFCQHHSIVKLLAQDAELRSYGIVRLDGTVSPEARAVLRVALEESPETLCAVAQYDAAATGSNFRSISHVVYLECPTLFATYWQSRGRAIRNLGPEDVRFARTAVGFSHIVQGLPQELLEVVEDPALRAELGKGTLSERWQAALLQKRDDFLYLMRRKKAVLEDGTNAALAYVTSIADASARSEFASDGSRLAALLTPGSAADRIVDYGTRIKQAYRNRQQRFLEKHRAYLSPEEGHVMALVGPEGLEVAIYDRLGYPRHGIHCVEGGSAAERKIFRQTMRETGCRAYETRIERIMPHFPHELEIFSLDRDGYLMPSDLDTFRHVRLSAHTVVIKNALGAREEFGGKELLSEVAQRGTLGDRRELLERAFFKLLGTAHTHPFSHLGGVEALRFYSLLRYLARDWSDKIGAALSPLPVNAEALAEYLADTYLGSPTIEDSERFSYRSRSGKPFLSLFALVTKPDEAARATPFAEFIQRAMTLALTDMTTQGSRQPAKRFEFRAAPGALSVSVNGAVLDSIPLDRLPSGFFEVRLSTGRLLAASE